MSAAGLPTIHSAGVLETSCRTTPMLHPPLLGSWRNLYSLVIGALVVQILLYTWISWMLS